MATMNWQHPPPPTQHHPQPTQNTPHYQYARSPARQTRAHPATTGWPGSALGAHRGTTPWAAARQADDPGFGEAAPTRRPAFAFLDPVCWRRHSSASYRPGRDTAHRLRLCLWLSPFSRRPDQCSYEASRSDYLVGAGLAGDEASRTKAAAWPGAIAGKRSAARCDFQILSKTVACVTAWSCSRDFQFSMCSLRSDPARIHGSLFRVTATGQQRTSTQLKPRFTVRSRRTSDLG